MADDALYLSPAAGFAELADTYDARLGGNPLLMRESAAVQEMLPDLKDVRRAIDFACGTGRYALYMASLGAAEVVGLDIAPPMLVAAERKARRAELSLRWEVGDLESESPLPIEAGTAEVGICALALSFLTNPPLAFQAMARTLAPGGVLIVSDYHPQGLCAARAASRARLAKDYAPFFRFTTAFGEECRIRQTPHQISDLFQAARDAGLLLERIAEPLVDHRLASDHGGDLRERIGTPLALVMRLTKRG